MDPSSDIDALSSENVEGRFCSCVNNARSKHCYPGGDVTFSSAIFLTLYEEEEFLEQSFWPGDPEGHSGSYAPFNTDETVIRPTIYYILRLFDSLRGFHKVSAILSSISRSNTIHDQGYLDLTGRHPEASLRRFLAPSRMMQRQPQRYYALQSQWNRYLYSFLCLETETRAYEELNSLGVYISLL